MGIRLRKAKAEVERILKERIAEGRAFVSPDGLALPPEAAAWDKINIDLLSDLFEGNEVAHEYRHAGMMTAIIPTIGGACTVLKYRLENLDALVARLTYASEPLVFEVPVGGEFGKLPHDRGEPRIVEIFDGFHRCVCALRTRHDGRAALTVADEYDVQDLLRGLLLIQFEDVRAEEWTKKHAGAAGRIDFIVPLHDVAIEVKMMRAKLSDLELRKQLIEDIECYRTRSDCKTLLCFVYDPEHRLKNPATLADLERDEPTRVRVFVRPQR